MRTYCRAVARLRLMRQESQWAQERNPFCVQRVGPTVPAVELSDEAKELIGGSLDGGRQECDFVLDGFNRSFATGLI
jgi:hypothetical protein